MLAKRNQSGSVLVISMIILLVFAAIISVLALIVVNNLRYVTGYSQTQQSSYSAEAGVEQGLYYIQAGKTSKKIDVASLSTLIKAVSNNAVAVEMQSDDSLRIPLTTQSTKQLNLYSEYNNDDGYLETKPLDIITLALQWTSADMDACGGHTNSIELSDTIPSQAESQTRWVFDNCSGSDCVYGVGDGALHQVRLKSLYCDVPDLTISAMNNSGNVSLQDTVILTGTGSSGKTQQQVTAKVLWHSPLINYFDYVLFSEEQVTK